MSAGVTPLPPSLWCSCLHSQGQPGEDLDASFCSLYLLCGASFSAQLRTSWLWLRASCALQLCRMEQRERSKGARDACAAVRLGASIPPFPPRIKHSGYFEFRHNTLNNLLLCCHLLTVPLSGHIQSREHKLWCHKSWVTLRNGLSKNMSS